MLIKLDFKKRNKWFEGEIKKVERKVKET